MSSSDTEDHHFKSHRPSDSEDDFSAESPSSEHGLPQRLTAKSSTSTPVDEDLNNNNENSEKVGYFPTIDENPVRSRSSWSSRRPSIASTASVFSVREIFGDMNRDEIQLARQRTRETILSKVSTRKYDDQTLYTEGQDNVGNDGTDLADYDPELVTWDGTDDPQNPRNWSPYKKWITTFIVALYTMVSPLSSSILSPALPVISQRFDITSSLVESLTVSIFILAWAICPLFMAPLSEVFGRKVVLNGSIILMFIFNLACGFAQNTGQLLAFRFWAGMAGAPPLSVGAGTLADMFDDQHRNTPLALYSIGPLLGPVIAPIMAGWMVEFIDWRWILYVLAMINGAVAIFGLIFYRESYAPVLLKRKADLLRKESGNENLHTVYELNQGPAFPRIFEAITRPIKLIFTHPIIVSLGMFMAFTYGFMYIMLVTFPALWSDAYHYSSGIGGMMYLGLGIGFMLGVAIGTPAIQHSYMSLTAKNGGVAKPEYRIALVSPIAFVLGCGLIWYGWSAEKRLVWIMPLLGTAMFGMGQVPTFQCIQNYLIDMNPRFAASAVGAAAVFRSCFGFGFPLFGDAMYAKLGYGWANTLCGILAIVFGVPFPLFIYFYGERIRKWADKRLEKKL